MNKIQENICDLDRVLLTSSSLAQSAFIPGQDLKEGLASIPILCIGAGGLGCEILKNLALSGLKEIHVIDLDTIDFLFRKEDVGKFKAIVAAEFIMKRCPFVKVIPYTCKIQDKPAAFYDQFPVIIGGLDNVEARRWINSIIVQMVQKDQDGNVIPETMHYFIDGGTEGLNGQSRVISPYTSACYECTIQQLPKQTQYQMCTIANTPRLPEHCIAYAYEVLFDKTFPGKKMDKDSYEDMNWVYQKALERGQQFGIQGVTYKLTMGVVKNIIPAVASTNALIAAHCVNEAFKILTGNGQILDNYFKWIGQAEYQGVNTTVIQQQREDQCAICNIPTLNLTISKQKLSVYLIQRTNKLIELYEQILSLRPSIHNPSLYGSERQTLITNLPGLKQHFEHLKEQSLQSLLSQNLFKLGEKLLLLDTTLPNGLEINLNII